MSLTFAAWLTLTVVSRVGKKHSVVIPKEVRERVPVAEGEAVVWSVEGDRIVLKPTSFRRLAGIVKTSRVRGVEWVKHDLEGEIGEDAKEAFEECKRGAKKTQPLS